MIRFLLRFPFCCLLTPVFLMAWAWGDTFAYDEMIELWQGRAGF